MNLVSCCGFAKNQQTTVFLTCCSAIGSYYPFKGFIIVKKGGLDKLPISMQKQINAVAKHYKDSVLTCKMSITVIFITLNKIYITGGVAVKICQP